MKIEVKAIYEVIYKILSNPYHNSTTASLSILSMLESHGIETSKDLIHIIANPEDGDSLSLLKKIIDNEA